VTRVVVLGGTGFFGRTAAALLRADGLDVVTASRRSGVDAEDRASLRGFVREGDVVLDAAGPFQRRTTALVDVAIERRVDVVDLSDGARYARLLIGRRDAIAAAGIAVLSGCSAISAVVATLIRRSGVVPERVDVWLAPATRETANLATARALLASLRGPVWRSCDVAPLERIRGVGVESGLDVQLAEIWPSLREVAFWVDPHVPGLAPLLDLASRSGALRAALDRLAPVATRAARLAGRTDGAFAVRIEGESVVARWALMAPRGSYLVALAPAVLATRDLATGRRIHGLVPADAQVTADALLGWLAAHGVAVTRAS
jgi:hypothetical protein